ncbi:MAG: hypothetical protein EOL87_00950 [Spartobacteria bacterium]|nr:hypothetical protein [Spartobacteria bacterium]
MPKIDECEIPGEIIDILIQEVPDDDILDMARTKEAVARGFQLKKSNVSRFRERLRSYYMHRQELDLRDRRLLACGFNTQFLIVLSSRAIKRFFHEFMMLHGAARLLGGMLVDEREDVRALAKDYLENNEWLAAVPDEQRARAVKRIEEGLDPFLTKLAVDLGSHVPHDEKPSAVDHKKIDALKQQLTACREKVRNTSALQKKIDKLAGRYDEAQHELAEASTLLQIRAQRISELEKELHEAEQKRAALIKGMCSQINEEVERELHSSLRPWLDRPMALDRSVALRTTSDEALMQCAKDTLDEQTRHDRHYGNIRILQERHARFMELRNHLQRAREEALNPLASLGEVQKRIEARLIEMDQQLQLPDARTGSAFREIKAQIEMAESPDAMDDLLVLIEKVSAYKLFPKGQIQELYKYHHNRMAFVYARFFPNVLQAPVPEDPFLQLKIIQEKNEPAGLFIDGHNLLFTMPELCSQYTGDCFAARLRAELIQMIRSIVYPCPKLETRLYFDGCVSSRDVLSENMCVIYSGGTQKKDRADKTILRDLEECCRTCSARPRFLVTNDRELRQKAIALCARPIHVQQFAMLIK